MSGFFEPPPPPPEPPRGRLHPDWFGPPENVLGVAVPLELAPIVEAATRCEELRPDAGDDEPTHQVVVLGGP